VCDAGIFAALGEDATVLDVTPHRPLIGISSYPRTNSRSANREVYPLPASYVDAVRAGGGVPLILPPDAQPARLLDAVDGLILSGGGDIAPEHYSGAPHDEIYGVSKERDRFEIELARAAMGRDDLPLLCICRGMQVLNVALGGDLHAHLPDLGAGMVEHRLPARLHTHHQASVSPESRLASWLGATEVSVCSWHHQAIRTVARGLKAVAWAEDGVIEAVEHEEHERCIAVQWHPEMQTDDDAQLRLLRGFIELCSRDRRADAPGRRPR
jgi:putative glutamine amidotransferase